MGFVHSQLFFYKIFHFMIQSGNGKSHHVIIVSLNASDIFPTESLDSVGSRLIHGIAGFYIVQNLLIRHGIEMNIRGLIKSSGSLQSFL